MSEAPAIWLDGSPCKELPLPDRALDFGDGLFETLLLRDGSPLFPELHLQRLQRGLRLLHFPDCLDEVRGHLESAVSELAGRGWNWSVLRITVSRGGGPRGYAPPDPARPRVLVSASPLARDCTELLPPAELALSTVRWPAQPLLAGIKHLNRLEQVLAAREVRDTGADEAVMLDQEGGIVSAIAGNIFLVREAALMTPAVDQCGIAGTRRRLIIEHWAPALGIPVEETTLDLSDLVGADEVFICNSLLGLRPVGRLGDHRWERSDLCRVLFDRYLEEMD